MNENEGSAAPVSGAAAKSVAPALMIGMTLTLMTALNPVSIDTLLPAIPFLRREFNVAPGTAQLALSFYIMGFAAMQLVFGPLSDRFGRKPVLLVSLVLYCAATLVSAVSPTFEVLILGRTLQGIGAAAGPVIGRAIIRDLYGAERSGKVLSYVMAAFGVIAVASPVIGGTLIAWFGWRSTFLLCLGYAGMTLLFSLFILHETLAPENRQAAIPRRIWDNMRTILRHPTFRLNTASNCASYSAMFVWLSGGLYALIEVVEVPVETAAVYFALAESGFMSGAFLGGRLATRFRPPQLIIGGAMLSVLGAAMLWGLAASGVVGVAAIAIPGFLWTLGYGFYFPNTMAGAVAPFPTMAGAASSLIGFLQMVCGAVAAWATGFVFDGSSVPFGFLMFALTALGLAIYLGGRRFAEP